MPTCHVCGKINVASCTECYKLYEQDIAEGRIPPQFKTAGEKFQYSDWKAIRIAEKEADITQCCSPEEIFAVRKAAADKAIAGCLARHRAGRAAKTPAQEAKEARDALRSRYTY